MRAFWQPMARDEQEHLAWWERTCRQVRSRELPNIFDTPGEIIDELHLIADTVATLTAGQGRIVDDAGAFLIACRLEFYLLHPAFPALFLLLGRQTGDVSPLQGYQTHMETFIGGAARFCPGTPTLCLLGDLLLRIWKHNRTVARQIGAIRNLKDLIPMCAHCSRVRIESGVWERIGYYENGRMDDRITHWICPACLQELSPEWFLDGSHPD